MNVGGLASEILFELFAVVEPVDVWKCAMGVVVRILCMGYIP